MKLASLRLLITVAGSIGLASYTIAGPTRVSPGNSTGAPASSNFGTQGAPTNASPESTSGSQSKSNSGSSSSGDENPNVAGTDADGLPVLRKKPGAEREKIIQLKDGQKLPTSGVDPKFQGSLLNTSIDSIASVAPRKDKDAAAAKVDVRVQKTDPNSAKDGAATQKKSEPADARPKENPVSTSKPSATASPAAKSSSERTP